MSTTTAEGAAEHHEESAKAREAFRAITRDVAWVAEAPKPHKAWLGALGIALLMLGIGVVSIYHLVTTGIGVWGNSNTVGWAWDITNFVWWIGIGHAGTLISAVLFLTRQTWRVSINRAAEAMTIFAVMCALLFPLLHTGRPWFAWWMLPHPNDMGMWPQFRSPLMWDVFAVSTYATTSILFWYMGLVPDLATFRDRCAAKGDKIRAIIYGILSLGWRGPARHWHRYERMYLLLCAFALGYLVLYPGLGSYKGTLGFTAGNQVLQEQEALNARIQPIYERFRDMPIPEIAKDAQARDIGQRLFLNNCAQCHGSDAKGGRGFPNLTDNDWLWGGLARSDPADHHQGPARHDAGLGCGHQTGRSIGHRPVRAFAVGPGA